MIVRIFPVGQGPPELVALVKRLLPLLIVGDHPALVVLRQQLERTTIGPIECTRVGFFATLVTDPAAPTTEPANLTGGDATIALAGLQYGAGCVLFVVDGRLSMLEGYTRAGEPWAPETAVCDVTEVVPLAVAPLGRPTAR